MMFKLSGMGFLKLGFISHFCGNRCPFSISTLYLNGAEFQIPKYSYDFDLWPVIIGWSDDPY